MYLADLLDREAYEPLGIDTRIDTGLHHLIDSRTNQSHEMGQRNNNHWDLRTLLEYCSKLYYTVDGDRMTGL